MAYVEPLPRTAGEVREEVLEAVVDRDRRADPDILEGGSGGEGGGTSTDSGEGFGRPVAVPEGSPGANDAAELHLSGDNEAEEDQRGHEDDAGRSGSSVEADESGDDQDRYDYSYRHRLG